MVEKITPEDTEFLEEVRSRFVNGSTPQVDLSWLQENELLDGFVRSSFRSNWGLFLQFLTPEPETDVLQVESSLRIAKIRKEGKDLDWMEKEEFWNEFAYDLLKTSDSWKLGFIEFFMWADPQKERFSWTGKYKNAYDELNQAAYDHVWRDNSESTEYSHRVSLDEWMIDKFFNGSPTVVQSLLLDRFPKEFSKYSDVFKQKADRLLTSWEKQGVLEGLLQGLVNSTSRLSSDTRGVVLNALAKYLDEQFDVYLSHPNFLTPMLDRYTQAVASGDVLKGVKEHDLVELLQDFQYITRLLRISEDDSEAAGFLAVMEENLFIPQLVSALYKPASIFWQMYWSDPRANMDESAEKLDSFIIDYLEKAFKDHFVLGSDYSEYLRIRIIPQIRSHFTQIAESYGQIKYFALKDGFDNPKSLYLHQIEAITELLDAGRGILADEPQTGKTLILTLTALNLIEQRGERKNAHGRVLVVGSKTIIDNWETQLNEHLSPRSAKIININHPQTKKGRLQETASLDARLNALSTQLEMAPGSKEIYLVNYDMFRHRRFQSFLGEHNFDVLIIDEAHHVKSGDLRMLDQDLSSEEEIEGVAKRTQGLYRFIRNNPQLSVYLATGTPYVKDDLEPLILANLIDPERFPKQRITELLKDPDATHRALREIMIRRRKKDIAQLPQKRTEFVQVSLSKMVPDEQELFQEEAAAIFQEYGYSEFAKFYSLLALESQAKFSWLNAKVADLTKRGKKVLIFTPFVNEDFRMSASMSTANIARYLTKQGVERVGLLDGTLTLEERSGRQKQFKLPMSDKNSLDVIVGNYQTAGESITLASSHNRATEVILLVCPDSVAKLVQAVDRVHGLSQQGDVTIHVPMVTDDILGRPKGTYDERIVRRLWGELARFERIIDGVVFKEGQDIYSLIVESEKKDASFSLSTRSVTKEERREFDWEKEFENISSVYMDEESTSTEIYFSETKSKLLTKQEEEQLGSKIQRGLLFQEMLKQKGAQGISIPPEVLERFNLVIDEGKHAQAVLVSHNLRLVISIVRKYYNPVLEIGFNDLIQEGNIGLMTASLKYDPSTGHRFSTYATWWIRQAVQRAQVNQGRTIRIPVHMYEAIGRMFKREGHLKDTLGRDPTIEELAKELNLEPKKVAEMKRFSQKTVSLDTPLDETESDSEDLYNYVADPSVLIESDLERGEYDRFVKERVHQIFSRVLSLREYDILSRRYFSGQKRTLDAVGQEEGITRERVRQIEERAFRKLEQSAETKGILREIVNKPKDLYKPGEDPERVFIGERRLYIERFEPLIEAIFRMKGIQAKIAYRRLYVSLSDEEIARELEMTVRDVKSYFNNALLFLWEYLPMRYFDQSPYLQDRFIYFPQLDHRVLKTEYFAKQQELDSTTRSVMETFFGFESGEGYYNVRETARELDLEESQVKYRILRCVHQIRDNPYS